MRVSTDSTQWETSPSFRGPPGEVHASLRRRLFRALRPRTPSGVRVGYRGPEPASVHVHGRRDRTRGLVQLAKTWAAAAVEMAAEAPGLSLRLSRGRGELVGLPRPARRPTSCSSGIGKTTASKTMRRRWPSRASGNHRSSRLVRQTSSRPSSDRSELRTSHPYLFRGWRSVLHEGRRRGASSEACPVILALPGLGCLSGEFGRIPVRWRRLDRCCATMARWKTRTSTVTFSASLRGGE